jgi:hypothetical protein
MTRLTKSVRLLSLCAGFSWTLRAPAEATAERRGPPHEEITGIGW